MYVRQIQYLLSDGLRRANYIDGLILILKSQGLMPNDRVTSLHAIQKMQNFSKIKANKFLNLRLC